jgi:cytochrome b561
MKSPNGYSRAQIALHWVVVVLVAGQYLLSEGIEQAWYARMNGSLPNEPFPNPHAIVGFIILLLTIWRVVLKLRHGAPALPAHEPAALKAVAGATHLAFYLLLLGMPISGALAWVLGLELPAEAHEVAAKLMIGLIVLHVAGAIVQKVWLKSDVLARMSPRRLFKRSVTS